MAYAVSKNRAKFGTVVADAMVIPRVLANIVADYGYTRTKIDALCALINANQRENSGKNSGENCGKNSKILVIPISSRIMIGDISRYNIVVMYLGEFRHPEDMEYQAILNAPHFNQIAYDSRAFSLNLLIDSQNVWNVFHCDLARNASDAINNGLHLSCQSFFGESYRISLNKLLASYM